MGLSPEIQCQVGLWVRAREVGRSGVGTRMCWMKNLVALYMNLILFGNVPHIVKRWLQILLPARQSRNNTNLEFFDFYISGILKKFFKLYQCLLRMDRLIGATYWRPVSHAKWQPGVHEGASGITGRGLFFPRASERISGSRVRINFERIGVTEYEARIAFCVYESL